MMIRFRFRFRFKTPTKDGLGKCNSTLEEQPQSQTPQRIREWQWIRRHQLDVIRQNTPPSSPQIQSGECGL